MELPRLDRFYRANREKGLAVVAVETSRNAAQARAFVESARLAFPVVENGEGEAEVARRVFRVSGVPAAFLVDREGLVNYVHVGFSEGDEKVWEREIGELLSRPGPPPSS